jgi:hypothetical protein
MTPPHGWQYPPPPPLPTHRLGLGARIALIIGGVLIVGAIAGIDRSDGATTASITTRPAPTPARAAPPLLELPASGGIGDGTWLVGTDIPQGTYRSSGARHGFFELCTWSTHEGASRRSDVIDFGTANADEPMVVTIGKNVRAFVTSNCEPWIKIG